MTLIFDMCEGNRVLRNIFYINVDEVYMDNYKWFFYQTSSIMHVYIDKAASIAFKYF